MREHRAEFDKGAESAFSRPVEKCCFWRPKVFLYKGAPDRFRRQAVQVLYSRLSADVMIRKAHFKDGLDMNALTITPADIYEEILDLPQNSLIDRSRCLCRIPAFQDPRRCKGNNEGRHATAAD